LTRLNIYFVAAALLMAAAIPDVAAGQSSSKAADGLDLQAIDKSVNPCENFYQYACGNWLKQHPIPADESAWGRFDELLQRNQEILRGILENAEENEDRSATDQKIGGFYHSCMDEAAIEQRGITPLEEELTRIRAIRDSKTLLEEIARLQYLGVDVFFNFGPEPDPKNASMMIAFVDQGGLGLPERDYYFRTDPQSEEIRRKYVAHVQKMFELSGTPAAEAQRKAAAVMAIETDLARASLNATQRRDPQLLVHMMSKRRLMELSPNFNFDAFFSRLNTPSFSTLNVSVPAFITAFNRLVASEPLDAIKDYLTWHYVSASARLLTKPFVDENFDFYGTTLTGVKQLRPRWKRCVQATDRELGDALGREFVEKTFGEQGKERTLAMVHQIEDEMAKDIESISWMTPETKRQALIKLHAVVNKIGYPEKWRDYATVTIRNDDYFGNTYRANEYESRRELNKIGKPVDRQEWEMTPPTVNAYYSPVENNINFPAGILQPPFFSSKASDTVNFGAAGSVIGHELTHAFDDEGRQYDADGNLKDWWQKSDEERFKELAQCFEKEYSAFTVVPGVHLNGKLTLGENTADNGGLRLAYLALLDDLAKKHIPLDHKVDGYTEPQQFFLAYGQIWCEAVRPQEARLLAQTDPHSMPEFRVNGVVSNMPQFSAAFGCKPGDNMYVVHACRVW
jgi:putative endopeptidase